MEGDYMEVWLYKESLKKKLKKLNRERHIHIRAKAYDKAYLMRAEAYDTFLRQEY